VATGLARYACAHTRQGLAPRLGDRLATFVAVGCAVAARGFGAGAQHGVLDGIVDLVVDRAVAGPAAGHQLSASLPMVKQRPAQISFRIVASAPPSISHLAPLT